MRLAKKSIIQLVVVLLIPALYGLNYLITPDMIGVANLEASCRPKGKIKFSPVAWKGASPDIRYEMVDDLLTARTAINIDANDVEQILGKPDLVSDKEGGQFLFYILGDQRKHPSKSIWFPGLFPNQDRWMLEIRVLNGKTHSAKVFFT